MNTTALARHGIARREYRDASDASLVACFAAGRDQSAFAEIVRRHGPMVMNVARGITRNESDAEDAFQATFLALATAAKRVRKQAAVAGWLQQTAVRTAKSMVRANQDWRRKAERKAQKTPDRTSPQHDDRAAILHEELQALPPKLRTAVVLCDLEGLTRKAAASRLGLPTATVISQVARGRQLLRQRLVRRGVGLSAGGMAARMAATAKANAPISQECVQQMTTSAALYAAGKTAAEIGLSQAIVNTAREAILAMTTKKLTSVAAAALTLVVLSTASIGGLATMLGSVAPGRTVVFFDDFNDEDAADGMPGTWLPGAEPGGTRDASSGDFEVSNTELMSTLVQELDGLRDVSIRAQLRFTQLTGNVDLAIVTARSPGNPTDPGAYGGGIATEGTIFIANLDGSIATASTALDPVNGDVLLQFDVIGDRLSLTAWQEGDPMPNTPQLVVTDSTISDGGQIGFSYRPNFNSGNAVGSAVFRYYEVAVPEPSSAIVGAILCLGVVCFQVCWREGRVDRRDQ